MAPEQAIPGRLAEAKAAIVKGDIDEGAWAKFRESGGSSRGVADRVWMDELALPDVDPGALTGRVARTARDVDRVLVRRVDQSLVTHLRSLTRELATVDGKARLRGQVDRIAGNEAGWSSRDLVDPLWREWVGPARIGDLHGGVASTASGFWKALDGAISAALTGDTRTPGVRTAAFSPEATGRLDPVDIMAVMGALERQPRWVVGEDMLDALTDAVFLNVGQPVDRTGARWQGLRGSMRQLVVVAEVTIIDNTIPQGHPVGADRWAELRGRYVATITKPIWRYWQENIVDASFFGNPIRKRVAGEGLAREVAQAVRLVEQSAMRLGGFASMAELHAAQGTKAATGGLTRAIAPGTEFRFEPVSHADWMRNAAHLSFHGTGRALDFRAAANPAIKGEAHQLISILGGGELSENSVDRGKLAQWAGELAPLMNRRAVLEESLAAATTDAERDRLRAEVDHYTEGLGQAVQVRQDANDLRDRATVTYQKIVATEAAFQAAWATLSSGSQDNATLVPALVEKVAKAQSDAEASLAAIADDRTQAGQARVLRQRLDRIGKLRTMLEATSARGIAQRDAMLQTVASAAAGGLTDLPLWMVQAFAEQGWSWGGTWTGFSDAMHFDYMGPVSDVIAQ